LLSIDAAAMAPPTPTALIANTVRPKPSRTISNASHPIAISNASGQNRINKIAQRRKDDHLYNLGSGADIPGAPVVLAAPAVLDWRS
jgi:hypothetical protein